jgi:parallel beta helix pectate lyase-like protein
MKRFTVTFVVVLAITLIASTAHAQAIRTWVSGVGDDANPCSRTAPCKTFAGAISKTAAHGEISVLDPGGFGAVVITKSITINGISTHAGISASGVNGITINAGANDAVVLRNLQINGAGSGLAGIRLLSLGTNVVVDRVIVQGFATGILTTDTSTGTVTVIDSTIADNHGFGVLAQGGSISVLDSKIVSNQVAVQADPLGTVRLSNNDVMNNKTGFGCGAGVLASAGNNRKANNVGGLVPVCTPTMTITVQ